MSVSRAIHTVLLELQAGSAGYDLPLVIRTFSDH